jgi:hypothetical protein
MKTNNRNKMEYYFIVVDTGGDREEGVISKRSFDAFMNEANADHQCEIPVVLSITDIETILEKMKRGKTDLNKRKLNEFTDMCLHSGGG